MIEDDVIDLGILLGMVIGIVSASYVILITVDYINFWLWMPLSFILLSSSVFVGAVLFGTMFGLVHRMISRK